MKCFVIIQIRGKQLVKIHHARPKRITASDDAEIMKIHHPHDSFIIRGVEIK